MATYYLGKDAVVLHGTAGTTAATATNNTKDVSISLKASESDVSIRGSKFEKTATGMIALSYSWEMVYDMADAACAALHAAFIGLGPIAIKILDKPDGQGFDGDFCVTQFEPGLPLKTHIPLKIEIKPTLSSRDLAWVNDE
ncbi:MAG: hypothetical protein K8R92_00805 [Planctomycetes bacterium]|nr:hypothetical protein [Planctomycetota bacterium]